LSADVVIPVIPEIAPLSAFMIEGIFFSPYAVYVPLDVKVWIV
jgi:hypothetical protein